MKYLRFILVAFCLLTASFIFPAFAQVKQVQMKIDGYLCGN
jgi:hypothetical protein